MLEWAVCVLPDAVRRTMLEHAARDTPLECCGLLMGRAPHVLEASPARNEMGSRLRFRIDAADHFAAIRRARERGLEIVGAYHSHPSSAAIPSPTDRAEAWERFLYVIVSPAMPEERERVRAWCLADGNFREVRLVTEGEEACHSPCVQHLPPQP